MQEHREQAPLLACPTTPSTRCHALRSGIQKKINGQAKYAFRPGQARMRFTAEVVGNEFI